jgi:hypothetical protein
MATMRDMWDVVSDGKVIQRVSASDDSEATARKYIESKYPGMVFDLVYVGYLPSAHCEERNTDDGYDAWKDHHLTTYGELPRRRYSGRRFYR